MKIFLTITIIVISTSYAKYIFLLPEDRRDASSYISKKISKSTNSISIALNKLEDYKILSAIKQSYKKNISITVVSATCEDKFSLHVVQYKNVELFCSKNRDLNVNFIIFDNNTTCSSSSHFFNDGVSVVDCTCNSAKYSKIFSTLKARSVEYFTKK